MANDHLAAVGFCYVLWQRNSSGEEKGYHILYGSWRLIEDWKPVIDLCFIILNEQ